MVKKAHTTSQRLNLRYKTEEVRRSKSSHCEKFEIVDVCLLDI